MPPMTRTIAVFVLVGILAVIAVALSLIYRDSYRTQVSAEHAVASFNGNAIALELATTTAAQELGLGGRTQVPDDYGMLFIFASDGSYGFWMKDMKVPIDMFWLADDGSVVTMKTDIATSTYPAVFYPTEPVRYVLETMSGYAAEHGIHAGSMLVGLTFLPGVSK